MLRRRCPICQVLRGKKPGRGILCRDCAGNQKLRDTWGEYQIIKMIMQTNWMYRYLFPILMLCGHLLLVRLEGWSDFRFGVSASAVVAWGGVVLLCLLSVAEERLAGG